VAIAGAPGSGKSTLAEQLVESLNQPLLAGLPAGETPEVETRERNAVAVPMDGFHLDNDILTARGHLPRKGAPHTFDVSGLKSLLQRLGEPLAKTSHPNAHEKGRAHNWGHANDEDQTDVIYVPLFDRAQDLARNAAQAVHTHHKIILVEGNYLLLNRPGWNSLAALFDLSVMLHVPMAELETRLVQRWLDHGLTAEAARDRALGNDIPNAHVVSAESAGAELIFDSATTVPMR